jgi:hypothetical protein
MTAEQKLWKIPVLCEGMVPAPIGVRNPKPARLERRYTTVLVQAPDPHAAMEMAKDHAETNASPAVDWKCFTPLSASCFALPMALEDFQ